MALKTEVENLDNVDESLHSMYVEKDGKFLLDIEGGMPDVAGLKTALASEREASKQANKLSKELADKFSGIDLDKYKEILTKHEKDEEQRLIDEGKKDEVFEKKMTLRDAEWQKKIHEATELGKKDAETIAMHRSSALENGIQSGVSVLDHESMRGDATRLAQLLFSLGSDGKTPVMLDDDGETVKVGADGKTPLTVREWVESDTVKEEHPNWFLAGAGGSGAFQTGRKANIDGLAKLGAVDRLTAAREQAT